MVNLMLEILDGNFLFGMSPDVQAFKVRIFTSDLKFWIRVNEY